MKLYSELRFTDDFMFCKVLQNNPEICKKLLELILEVKIRKVVFVDKQKSIEIVSDGKGIRLDIYLEDDKNTVYNIEMQATPQKDLAKRSRYYQGMIDLNLIERGARYAELKKSFVIFICMNDPFGMNIPVYKFENRCSQLSTLALTDDAYKVFVNAACTNENMTPEMRDFVQYLRTGCVNGEFVQNLENEVNKARKHEEWSVEYMTLYMKYQEKYDEGLADGKEAGITEGEYIATLRFVRNGIITMEVAANSLGVTQRELMEFAKRNNIEIYQNCVDEK